MEEKSSLLLDGGKSSGWGLRLLDQEVLCQVLLGQEGLVQVGAVLAGLYAMVVVEVIR